jgi:hypothetical protein
MIEIKTDAELKKDLEVLIERREVLLKYLKTLEHMEKELHLIWRSIKDPVVKPIIHREWHWVRDTKWWLDHYIYRNYTLDINEIERILHSSPSINYGNIYEASYEDIFNAIFDDDYSIRGVKL